MAHRKGEAAGARESLCAAASPHGEASEETPALPASRSSPFGGSEHASVTERLESGGLESARADHALLVCLCLSVCLCLHATLCTYSHTAGPLEEDAAPVSCELRQ